MSEEFEKGEILWAKMARFPWWPAYVLSSPSADRREVVFFGDNTRAVLGRGSLRSWVDGLSFAPSGSHRKKLQEAVADAERAIGCDARLSSEQVQLLTSGSGAGKVLSTGDNSISLERPPGAAAELEDALRDALEARDRLKLAALEALLARPEEGLQLFDSRLGTILRDFHQTFYKAQNPEALGLLNEASAAVAAAVLGQLQAGLGPCGACEGALLASPPPLPPIQPRDSLFSHSSFPDQRTGFRVAKKISKTLHAKIREKPLGAENCRVFGERLERRLRECSSTEDEYRKSVLRLIDQPEDALRLELEKPDLSEPQLLENGKIKTIFRNCS